MSIRTIAAALAVTAGALSACATTVSGTGQGAGSSSRATDFPTASASSSASSSALPPTTSSSSTPAASLTCPTISYPRARLSFDCIVGGLTLNPSNAVWPLSLYKSVEASSGWVLEEGAADWGDPAAQSTAQIAVQMREKMLAVGAYGISPVVKTDQDLDTTVGGVPAHILQTTITLDPAWARKRGTKVTAEKLWIVVVEVAPSHDALWYTSIPNLASQLWAKVRATIATIRVS